MTLRFASRKTPQRYTRRGGLTLTPWRSNDFSARHGQVAGATVIFVNFACRIAHVVQQKRPPFSRL